MMTIASVDMYFQWLVSLFNIIVFREAFCKLLYLFSPI